MVIFNGDSSDYIIDIKSEQILVTDKIFNRDGINILRDIERLKFNDQIIDIN